MTSGTKTQDGRVNTVIFQQNSCVGSPDTLSGVVGPYETKTWNGGDGVSSPRQTQPISRFFYLTPMYEPERLVYETKATQKGMKLVDRTYAQWKRSKPPRGEHPYTMSHTKTMSDVYQRVFSGCNPGQAGYPLRKVENTSQGFLPYGALQQWSANDDIALNGKLRTKIQGGDFNITVFFAEGRESLNTIADGANRIYRSMRALKRGNPFEAGRALLRPGITRRVNPGVISSGAPEILPDFLLNPHAKKIRKEEVTQEWFAENWLQLQYGWRPIIEDTYNAARHLAYMQNRQPSSVRTYRASRTIRAQERGYTASYFPDYAQSYTRKSIIAKVSHVNDAVLAGLQDPASLAWELIPFSFVVDWFIPIGNYLQAMQLPRALTGVFVTTSKVVSRAGGLKQGVNAGGGIVSRGQGTYSETTVFTRAISSSLPKVDLPNFKGWEKSASWQHATNALALLIGLNK